MTRMKESGIDWIGQIPEEWDLGKVKFFSKISAGATPDRNNIFFWNGDINWMSSGEVNQEVVTHTAETITNLALKRTSTKLLPIGTVMLALNGQGKTKGTAAVLAIETASNQSLASFIVDDARVNNIYLYYFLKANYSNIRGLKGEDRDGLNLQLVSNIIIPLLDIKEQKKIADFLDKKTAQLDKGKALLEEQIQKLKDYRASLIYETVTKGLDKTVPMKNSGIDWIGQVPQGWGVDFANHIFEEHKQKNKGNKEKNLLSLSYGRIIRKSIDSSFGLLPESFDTYNIIQRGDIVLRLTDLQNDKKSLRVGLARENGIITSAYLTLRLKNIGCSDSYMYYLLHTYDICKVFYNFGGGVRQGGTWSDIYKLELLIPPYNEQAQITDFLDKKTAQIDQLIQIKNQQIKNINKQRQTLIYDYVTGKRRV